MSRPASEDPEKNAPGRKAASNEDPSPSRGLDRKTVLVLGTARSGTTWLAGLLAAPFRYRLLFEPFHPEHVAGADAVADHYYPPDAIPAAVESLCVAAVEDRIDSDWIAQDSNRRWRMHRWRFWPRARIVKSIRTNLLIPVYRRLFGATLPIVVLVRRPDEVVESLLRVRFPWATDIETLLAQTSFARRFDLPIEALAALPRSPVAALATRWVLENAYLLRSPEQPGIRIVHYDTLARDPVGTVEGLCSWAGLEVAADLEERARRPAHTTHPRSPTLSADGERGGRLESGRLDSAGVDTVSRVLALAALDFDPELGLIGR